MSDSCDITKPVEESLSLDERLDRLRQRHREVARYRVVKSNRMTRKGMILPKRYTIVKTGLNWDEASRLTERLTEKYRSRTGGRDSFGRPVWFPDLENKEEVARRVHGRVE